MKDSAYRCWRRCSAAAAVIAGNNSSQIEVVEQHPGLLANSTDPTDLAAKLTRVLDEPVLADGLKQRAVEQARAFCWEATADRAMEVFERLAGSREVAERVPDPPPPAWGRRLRFDPPHRSRPRIAFFSPLPPQKSGVSDYSVALLDELKYFYSIDIYHDSTYVPDLALKSDEFWCADARLFPRYAAVKDYHAVVYQMGNSRYHAFLYEMLLRYPGVVTLHDFCHGGLPS